MGWGMAPPKLWLGWSKCIETSYLHSEWTLSNFYVTPRWTTEIRV